VFHLDVAYVEVASHTHMLQECVLNVSSISDVCCSKCFVLQVFHKQAREVSAGRGGPCVCGKRSRRGSRHMHTIATGRDGLTGATVATRGSNSSSSTRVGAAATCAQRQQQHAGRQQELHATMHTSDRAKRALQHTDMRNDNGS
jgi:hypothetical protein